MSTEAMLPGVTVVVPTLNRGHFLLDTVSDLLAQTHRPLEILIVDQSETVSSELETMIRENPDTISYHRVGFRGLPIARNYGWQKARHDVIVYVDDDIRCGTDLLSQHVRCLMQPKVGLTAGGIDEVSKFEKPATRTGVYNRWISVAHRDFNGTGETRVMHVPGGNFGIWRPVLSGIRGVDEQLGAGSALLEETDMALRVANLGYDLRFNGAARLSHLAAGAGGTRQPDYRAYIKALAHNRSIMIRRHSRWYQWPVGLAYSLKLIAAYTIQARDSGVASAGLRGMAHGWISGGRPPLVTRFDPDPES